MGGTWRMPTDEQVIELFMETTQELYAKLTDGSDPVKVANGVYNEIDGMASWTWTYIDGHTSDDVMGKLSYMKLLSKKNSNFLVVPSSVNVRDGSVFPVGNSGHLWSASLSSLSVTYPWLGNFNGDGCGGYGLGYRCIGVGVRGVVGQ